MSRASVLVFVSFMRRIPHTCPCEWCGGPPVRMLGRAPRVLLCARSQTFVVRSCALLCALLRAVLPQGGLGLRGLAAEACASRSSGKKCVREEAHFIGFCSAARRAAPPMPRPAQPAGRGLGGGGAQHFVPLISHAISGRLCFAARWARRAAWRLCRRRAVPPPTWGRPPTIDRAPPRTNPNMYCCMY